MNELRLVISPDVPASVSERLNRALEVAAEATRQASAAFEGFGSAFARLASTPALLRKLQIVDEFYGRCRRGGFTDTQSAAMYARAEAESITGAESMERALARILMSERAKTIVKETIITPFLEAEAKKLTKPWIKESWRTKGRRGFA